MTDDNVHTDVLDFFDIATRDSLTALFPKLHAFCQVGKAIKLCLLE